MRKLGRSGINVLLVLLVPSADVERSFLGCDVLVLAVIINTQVCSLPSDPQNSTSTAACVLRLLP